MVNSGSNPLQLPGPLTDTIIRMSTHRHLVQSQLPWLLMSVITIGNSSQLLLTVTNIHSLPGQIAITQRPCPLTIIAHGCCWQIYITMSAHNYWSWLLLTNIYHNVHSQLLGMVAADKYIPQCPLTIIAHGCCRQIYTTMSAHNWHSWLYYWQ